MDVRWPHSRCILCLAEAELTVEHLIPKSIGGRLTMRCLCKRCNDRLGHDVEADAQHDPAIAVAIHSFSKAYPERATQLRDRARLIVHGQGGSIPAERRGDDIRLKARRVADGSLLQATPEARVTLRNMLAKQGLSPGPLEQALRRFDNAAENQPVDFGLFSVTKLPITAVSPDLSGPVLNDLVPVKTAFEFLAGHLGGAVYDDRPPLRTLRHALTSAEPTDSVVVERLTASRTEPVHGILFEGNQPHAQVQVRLFGRLAYRVHFLRLAVEGARLAYTHRLDTDAELLALAQNAVAT